MVLAQHTAPDDSSVPGGALQSVLQGIDFLAGAVIFKGGTDVQGITTPHNDLARERDRTRGGDWHLLV
ncbi:MAG: hypothetical protein CYG59_01825 [Chloroflexi bacterium]|nr:MAG: hypothetical protein CYG59_01825 [Chloroflexota bacterium]